jgi:hypothetical protein|tara:strand:- start:4557 stop:4847 length:291 start_codon:yes stop_codon:yes gene_type:complete
VNEYSEVTQLRTQIAIIESQLDHQTASLRQQITLLRQMNKNLEMDNDRQSMLIAKLSEARDSKTIIEKFEKANKKKNRPDPIGGLGPTEDLPGYDG